jgi:CheY-like chemotaxis protein
LADPLVLVVDDEPFIRMGLQDALEAEGFRVVEAADASEALRALEARPDIGIMITDVKMPGIDGLELANLAAAARTDLKIIIMSGHCDAQDARLPPSAHFMRKPFPIIPFAEWLRESSH